MCGKPDIQHLAVVISLLGTVSGAAAQDLRTIKGTVLDSANNKGVSGVQVYLDRVGTLERTGPDGTYRIQAGGGETRLSLRRAGYVPGLVSVPAGPTGLETDVGVAHIRKVKTDDDKAEVQAADVSLFPQLAKFYERKAKIRAAAFMTPDELAQAGGSLADLIRLKQGFKNMCVSTRRGELDCGKISGRGPSTIYGSGQSAMQEQNRCMTRIWTDDASQRTLDEIAVKEVLAVEAYSSIGITPAEYPGSPCATIMLWMRKAS